MVKIRVIKKIKENEEYLTDTQNHLYELNKEIRVLEGKKLKLQQELKYLEGKLKIVHTRFKPPSQDELFRYCDNLNRASKGRYNDN